MARILLVEDDETIRMALQFALGKAGYDVVVAEDGAEGLLKAQNEDPDLILLDIMLPGFSGIHITRTLRQAGNRTPIILLTALDQESDKVTGLEAGADDYVTKPFSMVELQARIRANLRRVGIEAERSLKRIEAGDLVIDPASMRVTAGGKPIKLRQKEYELLFALASRNGSLCTRAWLSQEVWDEAFLSTSRTLDTHIRRLRQAIDGRGWSYIHTEHGMGYRFEPQQVGDAQ